MTRGNFVKRDLRGGLEGVVDDRLERGLERCQVLHGPRRPPHLFCAIAL